jgi:hypothetical protein
VSASAGLGSPTAGRADLHVTGPVLFARYAYPPNALGYCGPPDPLALLHAADDGDEVELRHLAGQFEGAWPYLQLIAAANGLPDPLDRRVVRAYWLGNELACAVGAAELARSLDERFGARASRHLPSLLSAAGAGGVPQHSFHVFAVYPWLGLLRAGMDGAPLHVLDRCRIRWGRVEAVYGDVVLVRSNALSFRGARLGLGPERLEEARRGLDGAGFTPELQPGDRVSLHWDWVCERLTSRTEGWLRACTRRNLDAVNGLPAPGPAVACGV